MYSVMLKDGFSNARANARLRIENTLDLNRLFRAIDADPAIVGAGVVYIDNQFNVVTLRDFQPICSVTVKRVILREAPRYRAPQQFAQELESNPRESKVVFEAIGMGLSCVGAVIAWKVLGTVGAGLVPFTGGASTVIAYVGYAAAGATSLQCLNAFVRTGSEIAYPELIDWADSKAWYQEVSVALLTTYFHGVSLDEVGSPVAIAYFLLMILIVVSNYLIARGRPRWIWVMIILSTLGFFIVLPALAFEPDRLIYALGICSPLLCLLILNTPRHREFRQKCLEFRHRREADERELKAQRLLEKKRAAFRVYRQKVRERKALSRKTR